MNFKAMKVGDVLAFPGGANWPGVNEEWFRQMQEHTVETDGAVLYQVDTERTPLGPVIRFTVTRTQ